MIDKFTEKNALADTSNQTMLKSILLDGSSSSSSSVVIIDKRVKAFENDKEQTVCESVNKVDTNQEIADIEKVNKNSEKQEKIVERSKSNEGTVKNCAGQINVLKGTVDQNKKVGEDKSNESDPNLIKQWVCEVTDFSSQYDTDKQSANQIIGEPQVYPKYGDKKGAWAQKNRLTVQFISFKYEVPVYLSHLNIYETYHAGAIIEIKAKNIETDDIVTVWHAPDFKPENKRKSRIFSPPLELTLFKTQEVVMFLDCSLAGDFCEIDAVEMVGQHNMTSQHISLLKEKEYRGEIPVKQWVHQVIDFSSEYPSENFAASNVIGKPTVYPQYGDLNGVWAQRELNRNQYITLRFEEEIYVTGLNVYETFHAGAITRIKLKNKEMDEWVTVWKARDNQPLDISKSRIFSPPLQQTLFKAQDVRLDLDCTLASSYCEIDAVEMVGSHALTIKVKEQQIEVEDSIQTEEVENSEHESSSDGESDENIKRQWVARVLDFSSEYNSNTWSADQIIGEPKVYPKYGDLVGAWAQQYIDNLQYIVFKYEEPVYLTKLKIYETYHAGAVIKIRVKNSDTDEFVTVWRAPENRPQDISKSRIFSPLLEQTFFATQEIRLDLDCSFAVSWCEIDAVEAVGKISLTKEDEEKLNEIKRSGVIRQWVHKVTDFSSQYDARDWSAKNIIGDPDVYPRYGDLKGTWAQKDFTKIQYIVFKYREPAILTELNIYETYHAGAVINIKVKNGQTKEWVSVWQALESKPEVIHKSRIFSPSLTSTSFKTQEVRLELDCSLSGYCEIDAVEMVGKSDSIVLETVETNALMDELLGQEQVSVRDCVVENV